jgi:hypothetical protein
MFVLADLAGDALILQAELLHVDVHEHHGRQHHSKQETQDDQTNQTPNRFF